MIRKTFVALALSLALGSGMAQTVQEPAKVYFTSEITPESLLDIFKSLGVKPEGNVAVKISTGESEESNHLRPELIAPLVKEVKGTLVECNTAYKGNRSDTESHRRAIEQRGYGKIAVVDIMDAEGSMPLPMQDSTYFADNLVGKNLANYDFMINLAHFKGHAMGGFGGVIKNQSIGVASADGKGLIHTAGLFADASKAFNRPKNGQDGFLESMAGAAQSVHNYFKGKKGIVYINVMNNMSVDCDCAGTSAAEPTIPDIGILASTDILAIDQASVDLVYGRPAAEKHDLVERIESRRGLHQLTAMKALGMGNDQYDLITVP